MPSKLLYSQSTQVIKPYPRLDNEPIIGLDPDYLVLEKVEVASPSYDPATQSISSSYVVDTENLEYRQEWVIEDLPPAPVVPDWDSFNVYMLSDPMFKTYRDIVRSVDGELTGALFDAYAMIDVHGVNAFSSIWGVWVSVSGISEVDRGIIVDVARGYNLPDDFISIIEV